MRDMEAKEAHRMWDAGEAAIIDVREEVEHEATRIADVPLIPMSQLIQRVDEVPQDRAVVLICRSGSRSARVGEWLEANGDYLEVINLEGGIIAWAADGLPYEGAPPT